MLRVFILSLSKDKKPRPFLKPTNGLRTGGVKLTLHWSTLPAGCPASTINAGGLNFRIRNGNGCGPSALKHRDEIYNNP